MDVAHAGLFKTGAGRAISKVKNKVEKVKKKVDKVKNSKLGKIATAVVSTVNAVKKGNISKSVKGVSDTVKAATAKRSYPKRTRTRKAR